MTPQQVAAQALLDVTLKFKLRRDSFFSQGDTLRMPLRLQHPSRIQPRLREEVVLTYDDGAWGDFYGIVVGLDQYDYFYVTLEKDM